ADVRLTRANGSSEGHVGEELRALDVHRRREIAVGRAPAEAMIAARFDDAQAAVLELRKLRQQQLAAELREQRGARGRGERGRIARNDGGSHCGFPRTVVSLSGCV